VKAIFRRRPPETVYTVTDARRPMSEDIGYRERRYLITMGIRTLCFLLSIVFALTLGRVGVILAFVSLVGAVLLPYIAVIFANGGREPDSSARFAPYEPEATTQKRISGPRDQIGS
jgi:Protein of unknown function (DUF3099)